MYPTRAELFNVFANDLLVRAESHPVGSRISPEQVWTPGSDINLIGAGAAAMGEEVSRGASRETTNLTLDGAAADPDPTVLDRLVADRYSPYIARKSASPALVTLALDRPTAAAGAIPILTGAICQTTSGVRFKTLADVAFGGADLGPFSVSAEAVEAGTEGNVDERTITSFLSPPADNSILVTNPDVAAGGDSTESQDSLLDRARSFYGAARRGILEAIEFGARTVPGIRQATAIEVLNSLGLQTGIVSLYVADANGQSNLVLNALVDLALLDYRGGGVVPDLYGAVPVFQSIVLNLSYQTGTDSLAAFNLVRQAVVARVNVLAPGEDLKVSYITKACQTVTGVIVSDDSVTIPAGDVVPVGSQIIKTRKDLVTSS